MLLFSFRQPDLLLSDLFAVSRTVSQLYDLYCCQLFFPERLFPGPGAGDGTRTRNLLITNQLLCQLSHAGMDGAAPPAGPIALLCAWAGKWSGVG